MGAIKWSTGAEMVYGRLGNPKPRTFDILSPAPQTSKILSPKPRAPEIPNAESREPQTLNFEDLGLGFFLVWRSGFWIRGLRISIFKF